MNDFPTDAEALGKSAGRAGRARLLRAVAAAADQTAEGVTLADAEAPDTPLVYANASFYRLTGYTRDETLGRNCRFLQGPDTDPADVDQIRAALRRGEGTVVELLNYRKNGESFWNRLSISPIRDSDGALRYFAGIQSDITVVKQAEADLRAALTSKDAFFSIISHDLRGPVGAMVSLAELLVEDFDELEPSELREALNRLARAARNANALLENLLEWSRLQTERWIEQPELFNIRAFLNDSIGARALEAERKSIAVQYDASPELTAYADRRMLESILRNLLSNAVKFSPSGARVRVAARELADPSGFVELSVRDEGRGMDPEQLAGLARPGAHRSTPGLDGESGSGLGLVLCREFAERNGGDLSIESEPDVGTTVRVRLLARAPGSSADGSSDGIQSAD